MSINESKHFRFISNYRGGGGEQHRGHHAIIQITWEFSFGLWRIRLTGICSSLEGGRGNRTWNSKMEENMIIYLQNLITFSQTVQNVAKMFSLVREKLNFSQFSQNGKIFSVKKSIVRFQSFMKDSFC